MIPDPVALVNDMANELSSTKRTVLGMVCAVSDSQLKQPLIHLAGAMYENVGTGASLDRK